MLTYVCNTCNKPVTEKEVYIAKACSGAVTESYAFCPVCFSAILGSSVQTALDLKGSKFERVYGEGCAKCNTVEPEVDILQVQPAIDFRVKVGNRLTDKAKDYIRKRYSTGEVTYKQLASELDISMSSVFHAVNNE